MTLPLFPLDPLRIMAKQLIISVDGKCQVLRNCIYEVRIYT